jgi:small-conductance mechanosensitive channel
MKSTDAIHELTTSALKALLSWVRFLTGLLAGGLTVLVAFAQHTSMHPVAFRVSVILICITICVGSWCISYESNVLQRQARRLLNDLDSRPDAVDDEMAHIVDLNQSELRLVRCFYFLFLLSMVSMSMGSFVPKPSPILKKEAQQDETQQPPPAAVSKP